MATLGNFALMLAMLAAGYGFAASIAGKRGAHPSLVASGRTAAYSLFVAVVMANGVMLAAILTNDFGVRYVAENSSRATPVFYKALALWSAHEGSLLLWNLVLSGYIAAVAFRFRNAAPAVLPWALAAMYAISAFYIFLVLVPSRAFVSLASVPTDGRGPIPLLQNHWLMAVHPPFLYLGYIGFSVPFAFAIASLIAGHQSDWWIRVTRRWTLIAWSFLTVGLTLGALWSYAVLGWGGYLAWDPVENVALLPWLTATAFLHTSMIQERRGMLKAFNLSLVVVTFSLTIFGTFLTRSGIVVSVHTFSQSLVGPLYLGFLLVTLVVGFGLVVTRGWRLKSQNRFDSALSRESALLGNGWMLSVLAATIILGTLFPVVIEVATGRQLSVGSSYFNDTAKLPFIALIALMGVGPLLAWRRTSTGTLAGRLAVPAAVSAATLVALVVIVVRSWGAALTFALTAFVLSSNAAELRRVLSGYARSNQQRLLGVLPAALARNRRFAGALVVHSGVAIAAAAIAASAFATQTEVTLNRGQQVEFVVYVVRYDGLVAQPELQRMVLVAPVTVSKDGRPDGVMRPALALYPAASDPIGTPAIRFGPLSDLYISVLAFDSRGSTASFRLLVNPGVTWLWVGAAVMVLGGLGVLFPVRSSRPAEAEAPAKLLADIA